ncbi:anaerobic nitric oxide reductase flavorubredoxin [Parabacteroides sp. PF5-5]|uniref:FprA family A-type flavoprotein n=1 Tax=unclassified Parabacteroides TaxID=2649774 RepID=UPI0024734FD5|nr:MULTISPECIES: FprA family A-type flavoprotein [unclassified Parabacteroides]MDH6303567.1 anaerobic nitric oxide reductase flavorubredoxin [Parabacteroides sp. PH5-39]MDH6314889.1 anaerobic nitric oxide reductase flavorubredoxin [Parabacteroides sp. PF5-13]MDH6318226.1 anaerobic nitric oxide reductase flavorubredoxin [Parabacteroides sp. PH5-13]MDH6321841.1 anaerobic nitric oxide reductase flavorubredoxin [Parabacteroides sp. PH5-8]MDH6325965.1 anaerobic nitric oxide reductase flavorubredoxi
MYKLKKVTNNTIYVGVNDRQKALFENLWPLPHGVSYNSYLILDEKTVLIDTVDICYSDIFFKKIEDALNGRPVDYLVVDHMEPDHAGSIRLLRQMYPEMQIVGNNKTHGMLEGYHGITDGLVEVKESDKLNIGSRELEFYMAPMVHWPEVMFTYDPKDKVLFSADAFGTYGTLDGGVIDSEMNVEHFWEEMIRYYANIVGKYGNPVQKALQKLGSIEVETICSTHGPVWREHLKQAVSIYDRLSRYEGEEGVVILYGSMYGHTEQMAEAIASSLADNGIKNIILHNASKSHASYILRDVFKYKGLIVGSPTYSNQLFPEIESALSKIETREIKNRLFAYFGSFTWAGAAVKRLAAFGEKMGWEVVGEPVEQKQGLKADKYEACLALGAAMAAQLKVKN